MGSMLIRNTKGGVRVPERAASFMTFRCETPGCDVLHLVPERADGKPICEVSISREALQEILTVYFIGGHA